MPDRELTEDDLIYLAVGPTAAILLGMFLVPLRGFTTASNFTFFFMALTIATAEFGGRRAAVTTALCSALSLDFFLTEPYLKLTIEGKNDIIAFVGLTVCGLIAAALGSRRGQRLSALRRAQGQAELFQATLRTLSEEGPAEAPLVRALDAVRSSSRLRALRLRTEDGRVVAASGPVPTPEVASETLTLSVADRRVGSLDVWRTSAPVTTEERGALVTATRLFALALGGLRSS
jgi:K+-sensing histidine kinase KdpD